MKKVIFVGIVLLAALFLAKIIWLEKEMEFKVDQEEYERIHNFFTEYMLSPEGGVYTNYKEVEISADDVITKGHYILSESQGLLLEYAIEIKDKELFLRTWQFLETYMINEDGGFVWRVSPEYYRANEITSTLDDLQIILQLIQVRELWPELAKDFEKEISLFLENFGNYVYRGHLINGYDAQTKAQMLELESCYVHLLALDSLKEYSGHPDVTRAYSNGKNVLEEMYVGKEFPFTYERFYVETQMIEQIEEINMVEALLTALHLSQVEKLKKESKKWLEDTIESGIYGYYNTKGEAVSKVESSAIYGIVAQIAYYEKKEILYEKALEKGTDLLKSAIENPEKEDILSYDNLQLLIAYGLGLDEAE